jgi:hypothetical protein
LLVPFFVPSRRLSFTGSSRRSAVPWVVTPEPAGRIQVKLGPNGLKNL